MEYSMPAVKIFACTQSTELASKIAQEYGIELGKIIFSHFSDGEFQPSFEESVRGTRVFLIGSTQPSSENLMEMLLMIDAAKRASAKHHCGHSILWLGTAGQKGQTSCPYSCQACSQSA